MTSDSGGAGDGEAPASSVASSPLARLADLDRRIVPGVAVRLDRLLAGTRSAAPGRLRVGRMEQRILGALALVLLVSALALVVIGS